ncbi:MAG: serine/threonine-protein kinase [Planctomycetota bacterium]
MIRQVLGEGGFGVVYEAQQTEPVKRLVALKIIKPGMDSKSVISRFEAERQALALMDHPGIAKVFDGGTTPEGRPFFAMELVKGRPLIEHCDSNRLSLRERVDLFIGVCEAVQHAHAKGLIHRDLKPTNILVEYEDKKSTTKVIDFGVAKALSAPLTDATFFTQIGELIGTPQYMSPEQAEMTSQDIDIRSDVYSLGVVLYELLSGALPFDSRSLRNAAIGEIQRILREVDPPKPSTKLNSIATTQADSGSSGSIAAARRSEIHAITGILRRDLDWVVMRCLEKDRERRYATVNGLAEDLARFLRNEPVVAGPPSAAYRLRKFVRRHRTGVATAAVATGCVLLGLAGTTFGLIRAEIQQRETDRAISSLGNVFDLLEESSSSATVGSFVLSAAKVLEEDYTNDQHKIIGPFTSLANALSDMGEADRAAQMYERVLELAIRAGLSEETIIDLRTRSAVGFWRNSENDKAFEAIRSLEDVILENGHPADPALIDALESIAGAYKYKGDYARSRELYDIVLQQREQVDRTDGGKLAAARLLTTRRNIALLEHSVHRSGTSEPASESEKLALFQRLDALLQEHRALLGDTHRDTSELAGIMAVIAKRNGRLDDARNLFNIAANGMREHHGTFHWRTLETVFNLGVLFESLGDMDKALNTMRYAFAGLQGLLGLNNGTTMTAGKVYLRTLGRMDRVREEEDIWQQFIGDPEADTDQLFVLANDLLVYFKPLNSEIASRWQRRCDELASND